MNWVQRAGGAPIPSPRPMPDAIWQVCQRRGARTAEDIEQMFSPRLADLSHPMSMDQMDLAVERLIKAKKQNECIAIYADYDLDGTPGLVLLADALTRLGFQRILLFQPTRLTDGYGVHAHRLQELKDLGATLVVTVDVGIADVEAVAAANAMGLDVIITDHHLPKDKLPAAYAIVNPNKGDCSSGLGHLCGAGVAFYLALALRLRLRELNLLEGDFDPKELLDLFTLATLTDQVPLIHENRVLAKHGLIEISKARRPGLRVLLQELGMWGKPLSSKEVAFRLAPKLNALTRLEKELRAKDVLLAKNDDEARVRVAQMLAINKQRTDLQKSASKIADELAKQHSGEPFIWIYSHEFHPGVISLVASDLMSEHGVPAFVGSVGPEGKVIGSARSPHEGFHLQDILGKTEELLQKYGGHALAAGFSLPVGQEEAFRQGLREALSEASSTRPEKIEYYDAELRLEDLNHELMAWYDRLGPFGVGFESPVFLLKNAYVDDVRELKGGFLKYVFRDGPHSVKGPWFSSPVRFEKGSKVDVLFEPSWNDFGGTRKIEILINNVRPH